MKILAIVGLVLLGSLAVVAQEIPAAEAYAGFTWIRMNPGTHINAFTPVGGVGAVQYNFNRSVGVVAEFSGTTQGEVSISGPDRALDQTQFTYLFGPRVFINKAGRFSPFAEFLFGGVHNSRSFSVANNLLPTPLTVPSGVTVDPGATSTRFRTTQNAFAMAVGGGFDIKLNHTFALRAIQLDYLPTHFSPFNIPGIPGTINDVKWQHNIRFSAGALFRFGGRS